jgi:hypothetical protein
MHRHSRVDGRVRVLKDHLHATTKMPAPPQGNVSDVLAECSDAAGSDRCQSEDRTNQGGLSASRLTDQAKGAPGMECQRHPSYGANPFSSFPRPWTPVGDLKVRDL